ncbi:hypothetical protein [Oleispirillum naphthae]
MLRPCRGCGAEARQIAELSRAADGLEGVAAFAAKRKPAFTGR